MAIPARHGYNPSVVRTVLVVLLLVAAIILAIIGMTTASINPVHVLGAAVICDSVAIALVLL